MNASHWPFQRCLHRHLAGWHFANAGGCFLFRGSDGDTIDYQHAVAAFPRGEAAAVALAIEPNQTCYLAARAAAPSGVMELNLTAVTSLRVDDAGLLLPWPLDAVVDLVARLVAGAVSLEFSCPHTPGCSCPETFDIFGDGGSGELGLEHAIATMASTAGQVDYVVRLEIPLPQRLCVRPRLGQQVGEGVEVQIFAPPPPPLPSIL